MMRLERTSGVVESGELCDIELSDMGAQPMEMDCEALERDISSLETRLKGALLDRDLIQINPAGTGEINQEHSFVKDLKECARKADSCFFSFEKRPLQEFQTIKCLRGRVLNLQKQIAKKAKDSSTGCAKFCQRCPEDPDTRCGLITCICFSTIMFVGILVAQFTA